MLICSSHLQNKKNNTWQTLQQGCYTTYLEPYFNLFGPERIHILFYEELAAQPLNVMTGLCDFAGIDADFYNDYAFKVTNRSENMKNAELASEIPRLPISTPTMDA